jgi:hypothetical protein
MVEFRADLHCHSTCSDGSLTPEELIIHAKSCGLSGLSITDHDTIKAYSSVFPIAEAMNIQLISGVEFSASLDGTSIHLLGYSFSLKNPGMLAFCESHIQRRKDRNLAILSLLAKYRMPVSEDEMIGDVSQGSIGRVHIAQAMIKKGYVETVSEAFNKFIGEGCPCFDPGEAMSIQETVDCIRLAGGKAVIAHPHLIYDPQILNKLLKMDFDGIEVYYGRFMKTKVQQWAEIAESKGWLMTGGSDFHGAAVKPQALLGSSWISEAVFNDLRTLFLENNP